MDKLGSSILVVMYVGEFQTEGELAYNTGHHASSPFFTNITLFSL